MKQLMLILAFLPLWATAQECSLIRNTDPYTKLTRISTGFMTIGGARVNIESDGKEIDIFFIADGKCFNDAAPVYVFFEGMRSKMFYRNTGRMNCEGYAHLIFRNLATPNTALKRFSTHKVTQIVQDNKKKDHIVTLSEEEQTRLQQMATCLINEAAASVAP